MLTIRYIQEFAIHLYRSILMNRNDEFIRNFKKHVLNRKFSPDVFVSVQIYRKKLNGNREIILSKSPGAGSRRGAKILNVSEYAKLTSATRRKGLLLARLASWSKPELILELGTAFGVSTLYLNAGSPDSAITTIEGNPQVAGMAADCFKSLGLNNIRVINGSFDELMNEWSGQVNEKCMVFIDGNHIYEATVNYYNVFKNASLIVFDDIRWSTGMIKAWKHICDHSTRHTILDLFDTGILIKDGTPRKYSLYRL